VNLPSGFSRLESFVPEWALANERDRYTKLHHSSLPQLKVFYDAMLPEMEAVMEFLKTQPLEGMQPEAVNLYHLAMTFAETAHPLDLGWKDVDFPSAFPWERMEFRTVSTQF
jgi:hypothetical protein